jgi:hypothetical protein
MIFCRGGVFADEGKIRNQHTLASSRSQKFQSSLFKHYIIVLTLHLPIHNCFHISC